MSKACSTCGHTFPDGFFTCTCRYCGGVIEEYHNDLSWREYGYFEEWQRWQELYKAAPPRPLRDDDWYIACGYFNHCAICGGTIDEKLLVVPPFLGGRLYRHNVIPACETCAKRVRQSQSTNPIKSLYSITGANKDLVDNALRYLEAMMRDVELIKFDYDADELEIVVTCPETTSCKSFTGVYAKRIFKDPKQTVDMWSDKKFDKPEEYEGVTWRLIQD